jgi:hypothetical protein
MISRFEKQCRCGTRKIDKKNQRHREMMLVAKRSKAWGWPMFAATARLNEICAGL